MRRSVLFDKQKSLGAKFGEFQDLQIPRFYSPVAEEYSTAKKNAALMDRSYLGHLRVHGHDHTDLLHRITTNELRTMKPGEGQINIFTNEKGRIVDRVALLKFENEMRLITDAGHENKIADWIAKYTFIEDVKTEDISESCGILSVFGPQSSAFLRTLFNFESSDIAHYNFKETIWNKQPLKIVRTGELTIPGFHLIIKTDSLVELWELLLEQGQQFDLKPMGEDAFETLRIESGWPVYGKDFDEEINPHEAQMLQYADFNKGCYIGQEVVARLDTYEKVQKYLMGIVLEGDTRANEKDPIFMKDEEVGYLTSVTHSFDLNQNIALGYVRSKFIEENVKVRVGSANSEIVGQVVKLPFEV